MFTGIDPHIYGIALPRNQRLTPNLSSFDPNGGRREVSKNSEIQKQMAGVGEKS